MADGDKLLEIKHLQTYFFLDEGVVRAVDDVSLVIERGKTLGVVGESGCGKSVMARSILQIAGPGSKIVGGEILFYRDDGVMDLAKLRPDDDRLRHIRGKDIAMIFQEPMTSFAPIYTVGKQIMEVILCHTSATKRQARARTIELLRKVGIPKPEQTVDAYPFDLSGGMRQRAMIAMALAGDPALLIADEPTTALDVTIQAQILALMKQIQEETGMAIIMISHNMGVIAEMADEVAVMYLGKVVERAPVWELFDNPLHPYTQSLLKSMPLIEEEPRDRLDTIKGSVPSAFAHISGCPFHTRCPRFMPGLCNAVLPLEAPAFGNPKHTVRCHLYPGSVPPDANARPARETAAAKTLQLDRTERIAGGEV